MLGLQKLPIIRSGIGCGGHSDRENALNLWIPFGIQISGFPHSLQILQIGKLTQYDEWSVY